MRSKWGSLCRAAAIVCVVTGCELIATEVDRRLNELAGPPSLKPSDSVYNDQFLIIDLHADTLMWRRGLADEGGSENKKTIGQVDLHRLVKGNVGLQVLSMPTRVPTKNDALRCTDANGSDPAPLLAMANGWSPAAWVSPYHRALEQAQRLDDAAKRAGPPTVTVIRTHNDLEKWLKMRLSPTGRQDRNKIATILGAEGAHAFSPDLGEEFETLYGMGFRLVGPMHHFTNVYGGSSEGCEAVRIGLTPVGKRLVKTLFSRGMIVDVAHASQPAISDSVAIAQEFRQPLLVSHTGIHNYLKANPQWGVSSSHREQAEKRALSQEEIALVAGTSGTVGVIYWEDQIGAAKVDNIVGSITQAYCDLKHTGANGFWKVADASEHVSLGSDWDGAARNAIGADGVAAVTVGLCRAGFTDEQVANIAGVNACRVIAQRLSGGHLNYDDAKRFCRSSLPTDLRPCDEPKRPRTVTCPTH